MTDVMGFEEIGETTTGVVGGKAAGLAELTRISGVRVPPGFVVTTAAFTRADRDDLTVPAEVRDAISARIADGVRYAVRSSGTAEDSAAASFAGLHDTFLNVSGVDDVIDAVQRCWASLGSARATAYREHTGVAEDDAAMGVVIQEMVDPRAAGVLFTADPMTGNRMVSAVEAVRGLGEALVSGRVVPDRWTVRGGEVEAIGTGADPVLSDDDLAELELLGHRIEEHFGRPQDIEWCLDADGFAVVQSRPITTLFPVPTAPDDAPHVYLSVGHQQVMTDAMRPLGWSLWERVAMPPMHQAGGRLFVDIAGSLATQAGRDTLLSLITPYEPLMSDAIQTVVDRGFVPNVQAAADAPAPTHTRPPAPSEPIEPDHAIVDDLVAQAEASIAELEAGIAAVSGPAVFDFIAADLLELKRVLRLPGSHDVIMAGMEAIVWLGTELEEWLAEKGLADTLTQSLPDNVTAMMGLDLLDVADAIRPFPEVVAAFEAVGENDDLLAALEGLDGGAAAQHAVAAYLDRYGMRCVGEIDITRPRWSEEPQALIPALLTNVRTFAPGAGRKRFDEGLREAEAKKREVLDRLRALPDGEAKAAKAERQIDLARTFSGYREFPKYAIISRLRPWKFALVREIDRLVDDGVFQQRDDAFFLTFEELAEASRTGAADPALIAQRRDEHRFNQTLTPPRVLTSEGDAIIGSYRGMTAPEGALVGLAVSTGTVEGRARVAREMSEAVDLAPGDILVTGFTDPSWSPVFVSIAGLVTEVGGLTSHGSVIAREYGLPAVVGIDGATRLIRDGQRIRVHGSEGYVELLD